MEKAMKSLKSRLDKVEDKLGEDTTLCPRCARWEKMSIEELIEEAIGRGIPLPEEIKRWLEARPDVQQKVTELLKK